jgi:hypothetical protein
MGYTEPLRRFIQPKGYTPQVNEIPNTMPSWMPGQDYLINFQKGDPYIKVDEGYARLPGKGYEALHSELEGLNPEDYPDIAKMRILSDVAPYSREYQKYASRVRNQVSAADRSAADRSAESLGELNEQTRAAGLKVEYERITEQVRQTKESTLQVAQKHFNAPVDEISGTVDEVSPGGITLNEYLGRTFRFSSVSSSMADLTAEMLGRSNRVTNTRSLPGPATLSLSVYLARSTQCRAASGIMLSTASGTG